MLYPLIVPLDTIPASADVSLIGGKAAAVSRLITAGFPVPPGLCLTTAAFALALAPKQAQIDAVLRDHDLHQPAAATTAAQIIADQLADLVIPTEIMAAFRAAQSDLVSSSTWLAVRSSATDEDRAAASLAGQYETVLGVSRQDEIALRSAILTCWRSFFSPNALNARAVSGSLDEPTGMALLIQPLIEAECAGVCYTVDPVQQQRDRMIIDAAWGLGLGVVDGSVAADTTSIRRQDLTVIDRHVVNKPEQIRLDHNGQPGLRPVPLEQQSAACLSDDWLTRIAQFGLAAERLFGQHAATTAREYGVPAVIATRHATQRIPDGAWVTLDGSTGMVEIELTSADF
jgi:pyruvate,water dikinase